MVGFLVAALVGVVVITLALRYWYLLAIAGLVALLGVQQVRINHAHTKYAQLEAWHAESARQAEASARSEEARRQAIVDKEASDAQTRIAQLEADAASARDSADRLRAAVAAAVSGARKSAKPAEPSPGKPGADTLDVLSLVLARSDADAGELGLYADRLRSAGLACERAYNGLQSTKQ